jgi:hypothetical protein
LLRTVVLEVARRGGAGLVFHYPGYGDSYGEPAGVDLDDLSQAACDAVAEASRRCPEFSWAIAGFMLGASVACLTQRRVSAEPLLLVQPELRPGDYFRRLSRRREPLVVGGAGGGDGMEVGAVEGMAYGYPVPERIVASADAADAAVASALAEFEGEGVVIAHPPPAGEVGDDRSPVPERFARVDVPGRWRFGSRSNPKLAAATIEWLDRGMPSVAA